MWTLILQVPCCINHLFWIYSVTATNGLIFFYLITVFIFLSKCEFDNLNFIIFSYNYSADLVNIILKEKYFCFILFLSLNSFN